MRQHCASLDIAVHPLIQTPSPLGRLAAELEDRNAVIRVADVICQTMQKQLKEIKAMLGVRSLPQSPLLVVQ
jgi:hypothetical protein